MGNSAVIQVFYRLIRAESPEEWDFWTEKKRGSPLYNPNAAESWEHGVSVFIDLDAMINQALFINRSRRRKGLDPFQFIARLELPIGDQFDVRKTGASWAHYDVWDADPQDLLHYVRLPLILIQEGE